MGNIDEMRREEPSGDFDKTFRPTQLKPLSLAELARLAVLIRAVDAECLLIPGLLADSRYQPLNYRLLVPTARRVL